ncbi:MAG: hypothetical protein SFW36_14355 [Leptolyngbyaceae cyanobacterium bins.59]|nr:hypothetical protein [Leptolyngbyaceae cyanobacterium bins.59]
MDLLSAADHIVESLDKLNAKTEEIAKMMSDVLATTQFSKLEAKQPKLELESINETSIQQDTALSGEANLQEELKVENKIISDELSALESEKESAQAPKQPKRK